MMGQFLVGFSLIPILFQMCLNASFPFEVKFFLLKCLFVCVYSILFRILTVKGFGILFIFQFFFLRILEIKKNTTICQVENKNWFYEFFCIIFFFPNSSKKIIFLCFSLNNTLTCV